MATMLALVINTENPASALLPPAGTLRLPKPSCSGPSLVRVRVRCVRVTVMDRGRVRREVVYNVNDPGIRVRVRVRPELCCWGSRLVGEYVLGGLDGSFWEALLGFFFGMSGRLLRTLVALIAWNWGQSRGRLRIRARAKARVRVKVW